MKKAFFRATILLPLGLLFYSFTEPVAFCVPELISFLTLRIKISDCNDNSTLVVLFTFQKELLQWYMDGNAF